MKLPLGQALPLALGRKAHEIDGRPTAGILEARTGRDSADSQAAVFDYLSRSATYGLKDPVKRIDTHGAAVFLAGPDVYKVKKAVCFAYMDFSTLEKRKVACEAEIRVNRGSASGIYLGVVPIVLDGSGLHLNGVGAIVEWAVHLRRFDEDATLDRLADRGTLSASLIDRIAGVVLASHDDAKPGDGIAATAALHKGLVGTLDGLSDVEGVFDPADVRSLRSKLLDAFDRAEATLLRRGAEGFVRRCHGDLHLRNVAVVDGEPVLFDALEFDESLATTDVLFDLAFLLMDLCERSLRPAANRLMNRYLWLSHAEREQIEGLALMPLFFALRAAIRAEVGAADPELGSLRSGARDRAIGYLKFALHSLAAVPPRLVAIGGLSGTGKSSLAVELAPSLGQAPGAIHIRSDIERKRLFAIKETEHLPESAFEPDVNADVHRRMGRLAAAGLASGFYVILDATFRGSTERRDAEREASRAGAPFTGIWLQLPVALRMERVARRRNDASDATAPIAAAQVDVGRAARRWSELDATASVPDMASLALDRIDHR